MKKKNHSTIPDFSRAKPKPGSPQKPVGEKAPQPNPRQIQNSPTKAKNGGRRGT